MIIDAQEEQVFGGMTVVSAQPADGDLIQRHGNGPHAVLCQDLPEEPGKLVGIHQLVPKDFHKLVQHAA